MGSAKKVISLLVSIFCLAVFMTIGEAGATSGQGCRDASIKATKLFNERHYLCNGFFYHLAIEHFISSKATAFIQITSNSINSYYELDGSLKCIKSKPCHRKLNCWHRRQGTGKRVFGNPLFLSS